MLGPTTKWCSIEVETRFLKSRNFESRISLLVVVQPLFLRLVTKFSSSV